LFFDVTAADGSADGVIILSGVTTDITQNAFIALVPN
jgi:hypothetical protein